MLGHELSGNLVKHMIIGDVVSVIPYIHCGTCVACKYGQTNCCTNMQVIGVHQDGGMVEYLNVPASNVFVVNDLSLGEAAMMEPLSIGAHVVSRSSLQKDETVLIIEAGLIGLGVARLAKLVGAKSIIMDVFEERLKFAGKWMGSELSILATVETRQELLNLNDGELSSVVFDGTGNKQSMINIF